MLQSCLKSTSVESYSAHTDPVTYTALPHDVITSVVLKFHYSAGSESAVVLVILMKSLIIVRRDGRLKECCLLTLSIPAVLLADTHTHTHS